MRLTGRKKSYESTKYSSYAKKCSSPRLRTRREVPRIVPRQKNTGQRRFRGIIITRPTVIAAACVVSALIFAFVAWTVIKSSDMYSAKRVLQTGMADAVPVLSAAQSDEKKSSLFSRVLCFFFGSDVSAAENMIAYASPMFSPKEADSAESEPPAPKAENSPKIKNQNNSSADIEVKNETDYSIDTAKLVKENLTLNPDLSKPCVLIVHTHASESYTSSAAYPYEQTGNFRTQDSERNMLRVGDEVAKYLEKGGVKVIHDKTINDYPSYNDSYNKTENVIKKNLEKYPTIKFVFDIHRDALGDSETGIKFTSNIGGDVAAQVMTVCGSDTNLPNPNWQNNFVLALKIQQYFNKKYPTLMRPVNLRRERFNMHLTSGSLLFEVGTNSNTLDEALAAARYLGRGLTDLITNSLSAS